MFIYCEVLPLKFIQRSCFIGDPFKKAFYNLRTFQSVLLFASVIAGHAKLWLIQFLNVMAISPLPWDNIGFWERVTAGTLQELAIHCCFCHQWHTVNGGKNQVKVKIKTRKCIGNSKNSSYSLCILIVLQHTNSLNHFVNLTTSCSQVAHSFYKPLT